MSQFTARGVRTFNYRVVWKCESRHPNHGTQEIMSTNPKADADLLAEARTLLADVLERSPNEIEIVGIRGVTDVGQFWPAVDGAVNSLLLADKVDPLSQSRIEPKNTGDDSLSKALSPTSPTNLPNHSWPSIEAAGLFSKDDMTRLGKDLGVPGWDTLKFPELRSAVLQALNAKLSGQNV